jgi:hypothetical protein
MIKPGQVTVTLTPELRQLALQHVYETEQEPELDDLVLWFQEQETPNGYVLDAATSENEAHMIVVIARALLWTYDRCPDCEVFNPVERGHKPGCDYDVADN